MVSGQDKWMRVSGAWVLGEMEGSVKAAEMLMEKMADPDYHFKRRALKSLAKLVDPDTKKRLPAGKEKKVKSLISDISTKEQWIM